MVGSSATPLGDRSDLEAVFDELAEEMSSADVTAEVVMVGGSWLLWHTHRAATRDVDSATPLSSEVLEAARVVGARRDLPDGWLNDHAAPFWPADADIDGCRVVYRGTHFVVKVPPARVIFVMKLYRGSPQDYEDLVLLWPACGFESPADAVAAFWRGFPHAPDDEYLIDYVTGIAAEATTDHAPRSPGNPHRST